jgi:DNA-binding transcriptional LysR family regulator
MNDLDLNDIRTFVAVAQAATLTAAAKELQLPTSTVSRALTRRLSAFTERIPGTLP